MIMKSLDELCQAYPEISEIGEYYYERQNNLSGSPCDTVIERLVWDYEEDKTYAVNWAPAPDESSLLCLLEAPDEDTALVRFLDIHPNVTEEMVIYCAVWQEDY